MRVALISLAGQPRAAGSGTMLAIAGKTLAERQIEFAHAAGCSRVILVGDGASREAISLGHASEKACLQVQTIAGARGLLGSIKAADELLVLFPGLLPDAPEALGLLGGSPAALVVSAGMAVAAGFERIDLDRAWAGALVLPGALVQRLADLPPDIDPPLALLRVALQSGIAERRLPESLLSDGFWAIVTEEKSPGLERAWLARHLPSPAQGGASEWLATSALRKLHNRLPAPGRLTAVVASAVLAMLALGAIVAAIGHAGVGFGLVAMGSFLGIAGERAARLQASPFVPRADTWRTASLALVDLALVACSVGAIEGSWVHKLFPPLVLVGSLRAGAVAAWPRPASWLTDRAVLALALAAGAATGQAEPVLMAAALGAIALHAITSGAWRG